MKFVYYPIEIYSREIEGALLVAADLTDNGYTVLIGGKQELFSRIPNLKPGLFLLKSIVPGEVRFLEKIKQFGHKIIVHDIEGLVPSVGKSGTLLRYSEETIALTDKILVWGERQANDLCSAFGAARQKVYVCRHPASELWYVRGKRVTPNTNSNRINSILVATSFPFCNHINQDQSAFKAVKNAFGDSGSPELLDQIQLDADLQTFIFPRFQEFVISICRTFSYAAVIIRPHPTENREAWEKICQKYTNARLDENISIDPSLATVDALVHFNSTTSIQAHVSGVESFMFYPSDIPDELVGRISPLTAACSRFVESASDLCLVDDYQPSISEWLAPARGNEFRAQASAEIMNVDVVEHAPLTKFELILLIYTNAHYFLHSIKLRLIWLRGCIDFYTNIFQGRYRSKKNFFKYGDSKIGGFTKNNIVDLIDELESIGIKGLKNRNLTFGRRMMLVRKYANFN